MNIGIIGAGSIGKLYAKLWLNAGHHVMLSARHPQKHRLSELTQQGALVGTPELAIKFADVILLAVNYQSLDTALEQLNRHADDKLIIDATNPLVFTENGDIKRVLPEHVLAGVEMQNRLPQARVAKAFTSLWTGHVEHYANVNQPTVAMPFAADSSADQDLVAQLISEAGLQAVNLGQLADSRLLDPPSPVWNVPMSADDMQRHIAEFNLPETA